MGFLADDMTRLCNEIVHLRGARGALVKTLAHGADDRRQAMDEARSGFRGAFTEMTRKAKADCFACVSGIKRHVAGLRSGMASDLEGARKAWVGGKG